MIIESIEQLPASEQEITEYVMRHLMQQGCMSKSFSDGCQYRRQHGTSCAVGCLIPHSHYKPHFEGYTVVRLELPYLTHAFVVLEILQDFHDANPWDDVYLPVHNKMISKLKNRGITFPEDINDWLISLGITV